MFCCLYASGESVQLCVSLDRGLQLNVKQASCRYRPFGKLPSCTRFHDQSARCQRARLRGGRRTGVFLGGAGADLCEHPSERELGAVQ